ncbi:MAG: DUF3450 family protein [bacterium]
MKARSLITVVALCGAVGVTVAGGTGPGSTEPAGGATLAETRMVLDKWIETQQVIARERKDWQQGKETLASRLDLARKEAATIEEKIKQAEVASATAAKQRATIEAENAKLKRSVERLAVAVTRLEGQIRKMFPTLPDPIQTKLKPLYERIPADAATTKVSAAERFQNVLGILSESIKANTEIPVVFEVRNLANGKPAEVRVLYVGLGQAYYLSAAGQAGIGRPTTNGWTWEASAGIARDVQKAIEIQEGKRPPAFVGLPVVLQ